MPCTGSLEDMLRVLGSSPGFPGSGPSNPLKDIIQHWPLCHSTQDRGSEGPLWANIVTWKKTLDEILQKGEIASRVDVGEPASSWSSYYTFFYKAPRIRRVRRGWVLNPSSELICGACLFLIGTEEKPSLASVGEFTPFDSGCLDNTRFGESLESSVVEQFVGESSLVVPQYRKYAATFIRTFFNSPDSYLKGEVYPEAIHPCLNGKDLYPFHLNSHSPFWTFEVRFRAPVPLKQHLRGLMIAWGSDSEIKSLKQEAKKAAGGREVIVRRVIGAAPPPADEPVGVKAIEKSAYRLYKALIRHETE